MGDKKTTILSIFLLVVLALIIVSFLTSGRKTESDVDVSVGVGESVEDQVHDAESLLSIGETLHVKPAPVGMGIPVGEMREPEKAPKKLAEYHKEAVELRREKAVAVSNGNFDTLDSETIAAIDSIRTIRAKTDSEDER